MSDAPAARNTSAEFRDVRLLHDHLRTGERGEIRGLEDVITGEFFPYPFPFTFTGDDFEVTVSLEDGDATELTDPDAARPFVEFKLRCFSDGDCDGRGLARTLAKLVLPASSLEAFDFYWAMWEEEQDGP